MEKWLSPGLGQEVGREHPTHQKQGCHQRLLRVDRRDSVANLKRFPLTEDRATKISKNNMSAMD